MKRFLPGLLLVVVLYAGASISKASSASASQSLTIAYSPWPQVAPSTPAATAVSTAAASPVERLVPQVLSVRPHDKTAFTEGLAWQDGKLYESAGLYGQSSVRILDEKSGQVVKQVPLGQQFFGEGLAIVGGKLVQLTWHEKTAFLYDIKTLDAAGTVPFDGEGWGLCYDTADKVLYQSDGSAFITLRNPETIAQTGRIHVTLYGTPVDQLNELECVGDVLYANVWHTNNIMRIDKKTGNITAVIDASGLLSADEVKEAGTEGVLNGIAYDASHQTLLITGKLWPWIFEVRLIPAKGSLATPAATSAALP